MSRLVEQVNSGSIDRRTFMVRAFALGLGASFVTSVLRGETAAAQDKATNIGNPAIAHITTTDKGMIKFYSSWPLTGSYEQLGGDAVEAIKMALEDYGNAAGGFALEYEALDDGIAANNGGWDAGKESENANKVVNDPDAMIYFATYNSGAAKISIPITNAANMAQISYANTYPGLTKDIEGATGEGEPAIYYPSGKQNYMRTVPADDIQGAAGANWVFAQGKKKAYVIDDNSLYGKGVASVFNLKFKELGGEVLGFESYDPKATDYQSLMTKIADLGPEILYMGDTVDSNASKVLLDLRSLMTNDDCIFLGPDGLINQAFIDGAGDAAEGAYVTFAGFPPSELKGPGADYATRMTERLGHSPDAYAVYAYECIGVAVQAIDAAQEKDRGKILDAMLSTKDFVSLLGGTWAFLPSGDTDALTMAVNVVKPNAEGKLDFSFLEGIGV
ncbi:MAG: branched-chain amino acid ABC transporter substrate-binding protein [Thermomicrobiales bacterium]